MFAKRRLSRVFRPDGRSLIVAMDHLGFMSETLPGLNPPVRAIRECVDGGADAIMVTYGTARACGEALGDAGLIMTISTNEPPAMEVGVEQALRIGADAVKVLAYPFWRNPEPSLLNLAWLGAECDAWGMPLLAETVPGGWGAGPEMRSGEVLAAAARVAVEAGADFIKTFMPEREGEFEVVSSNCQVPVVILGGEKSDDDRSLLQMVRSAMDQGAAGVAIGRNIWAHPKPGRIVAALAAVIHDDAQPDEALAR